MGNFDGPPKLAILDPAKDALSAPPVAPSRVRGPESLLPLNEVVKLMHAEKTGVAASTQNEQRIAMRYFEEFLGEALPIHAITRRQVIAYKTALPKVPVKYSVRFPGLTLPEAIEANERRAERFPTLAEATVNGKWLAHLKAVFAWAAKNDHIPDDPSSEVRLDLGNSDRARSKVAFTSADLTAIRASEPFRGVLSERAWSALVAMHSGMRAGEIAQLRLDEIRRERGVLVFTVDGEVKNEHSRRLVPVHSALLALGLAQRIAALKEAGEIMLFPEWFARGQAILHNAAAKGKVVQKPYANVHPRWFNNYLLPSVGIEDSRKTFHCLRHTFKTALARAGVSREISDHICGHKDHSAGARYIHAVPIEAMAEAIERADFG